MQELFQHAYLVGLMLALCAFLGMVIDTAEHSKEPEAPAPERRCGQGHPPYYNFAVCPVCERTGRKLRNRRTA
ncbi:MAG TPA: hypothetical protein VN428_17655 [Bryobacteraceae bacterium]|nr:hypothetical protein [Bryobacteraceae bacterium]